MAKLSFNKENRIEDFTFIIARRDFYRFGAIKALNVSYKSNFNGPDELSLKTYKPTDNNTNVWDRINDYNIIIVPELGDDGFFDIDVDLSEDSGGVYKNITATSLAQSELSHTKIYNYEVNTEAERKNDKTWNKDNLTLFYKNIEQYAYDEELYKKAKHTSLLHRVLDKVPNYSIAHVDATLLNLTEWYQFSWDDQDIYSILTNDIAEQYHVLFKFNSRYRTISVYDLYSVCQNDDCSYRTKMLADRNITTRYRGNFQRTCPHCGSSNITPGYGKFTNIFVSKDNLMTSASVRSNKDSLINSFKIKSGDDLMDAAVMNQNPNGSNYIYQFSDENKAEMPPALVTALENYNDEYDLYFNGDTASGKGIYTFNQSEVDNYNLLISSLIGHFQEETLENFINLKTSYQGYQSLASQYYSVLDLLAFYKYSMTPDVETNHDSLSDTKALLETEGNLSPVAVTSLSSTTSESIVESVILQCANCIINTALYVLTVNTISWSAPSSSNENGTWRGTITIEEIEHRNTEQASEYTVTTNQLQISVNDDVTTYVKQRVEKLINRKDSQIKPLTDLTVFDATYAGSDTEAKREEFAEQLHYYSFDILKTIVYPAFQDVFSIIQENGNKISSLYYNMYYSRLGMIETELEERENQIATINSIKDKIDEYRDATKTTLNFQSFLGEELYNVFCMYRREDSYQNSNYISDNLDNSEIMRRAGDLIDSAQKELYKSSNLQYEVSGSLNNLLALPSFSSIFNDFEVGNWINMSVDDKVYNLRLLSYQISFDELQSISVEFSTVEKLWTGASDIQSVLKAAGSIAGSYSNTQAQVKQVQESATIVRDWVADGLEATQTRFANDNVTQEIVYDSSGFYARGYDEITGTYYPRQLKINKNGLYLTDDNWATMSTGIGAITYFDPDPTVNGYVDTYGVIAKTVVGKLILGENLKIYNQDASLTMNNNGLVISNGVNSFTVNPNNNSKLLALSNINQSQDLLWVDSSGVLHIRGDGSGLDISSSLANYSTTEQMNSAIQISASGVLSTVNQTLTSYSTTQQMNTAISQSATNITTTVSTTYETKSDANDKKAALETSISEIDQKADGIILSVKDIVDGNTVSAAKIALLINNSTGTSSATIQASHIKLEGIVTANNYFKINANGSMESIAGKIGGWEISSTAIYNNCISMNSYFSGTYIGTDGIRQYNRDTQNYVNIQNGVITAIGVDISGEIKATTGKIGGTNGWTITTNKIYSGTVDGGTASGDVTLSTANFSRSINNISRGSLRFAIGSNFGVSNTGILYTNGLVATNGSFSGSISIGTYNSTTGYPFSVTNEGVLKSTSGSIGPFSFTSDGLTYGLLNDGENPIAYIKPSQMKLSTEGDNKHSIYLNTLSGSDNIIITGDVNSYAIGYLNNIPDYLNVQEGMDFPLGGFWGMWSTTNVSIKSEGTILIEAGTNKLIRFNNTRTDLRLGTTVPNFRATTSETTSLGTSDYLWSVVYAKNTLIQESDLKNKDILGDINFAKDLIMALEPKRYMWKNGDHRRTRMGFIAQDVARICKELNQNLSLVTASYAIDYELGENDPNCTKDYFGEDVDDNKLNWGMAYDELIAPLVAVVQQQQHEIESLREEIKFLKNNR